MYKQLALITVLCGSLAAPALAQQSQGDPGVQYRDSDQTSIQAWQGTTQGNSAHTPQGLSQRTRSQTTRFGSFGPTLPPASTTQYGDATGVLNINQLPPTTIDSFVKDAPNAEQIYGDEGTTGPPPIFGFNFQNTMGSGITNARLSTGHASVLPSAWLDGDGFSGGMTSTGGGSGTPTFVNETGVPVAPPIP